MKLVFFPSKVGKFLSVTVTQYRLIKCGISDFTIENSLMNVCLQNRNHKTTFGTKSKVIVSDWWNKLNVIDTHIITTFHGLLKRSVECDRNSPLSTWSVTFYRQFSWDFRAWTKYWTHQISPCPWKVTHCFNRCCWQSEQAWTRLWESIGRLRLGLGCSIRLGKKGCIGASADCFDAIKSKLPLLNSSPHT